MAPQQNSTLIDSNLEMLPSLLNMPEEIERYSPILPFHNQKTHRSNNNNNSAHTNYNNANNNKNNKQSEANKTKKISKSERTRNSHTYKNNISVNSNDDICNRRSAQKNSKILERFTGRLESQGSHSVLLLHNKNNISFNNRPTEGHIEIPIWVDNEPRYISGITSKTTCNDIIRALIDDAIKKDGAAWRDYRDYVITESCRGIERNCEGNMAIWPVWKTCNFVHNEFRLLLKYQGSADNTLQVGQPKRGVAALKKWFAKFLRFTKRRKIKEKSALISTEKKDLANISNEMSDEFIFVFIPNDNPSMKPINVERRQDVNKNLTPTAEEAAKLSESKLMKGNLQRFIDGSTGPSKNRRPSSRRRLGERKLSERRRSVFDTNFNYIKRRNNMPNRRSLRHQLSQKTSDVDQLLNREYALTRHLRTTCKLYKLQNDLYLEPEKQLELSIGEIQRSIERYAKEIVRTENELLEVKNEIRQDISIINNLKRLTLESTENTFEELTLPQSPQVPVKEPTATANAFSKENERMQFVDNIYEFCDNNASMLV